MVIKKSICVLLTIFVLCTANLAAQSDEPVKSLQEELERMQQEMLQQFSQLNPDDMGFQLFLDSLMIQDYGDFFDPLDQHGLQPFAPETFDDLLQQMQEQFSQMDSKDWDQLGKMFENFGMAPFHLPQGSDPQQDSGSDDLPRKKDGSKRKIYKM